MNKTYCVVSTLVIAAGCSASSDGGETVGEAAQALTNGHTYNLGTLVRSGACMDVAAAGTADGTKIQELGARIPTTVGAADVSSTQSVVASSTFDARGAHGGNHV